MNAGEDPNTLLADVVDAFVKDVEEGRAPTIADYQARYPQVATLLEVLLPAVGTLRTGAPELEPAVLPERIGNYRIARELARGGMGVVLEAFQEPLERLVALKLVLADAGDKRRRERFLQEGRLVAKLRHPNVVAVYDAGSWKGYNYLALELLDGLDLRREVVERGPLLLSDVIEVVGQAAAGLAHAHQAGIIHRDVKPSNIFREVGGAIKVLDLGLGLAKNVLNVADGSLTGSADLLGTLDYMAPEQLRNSRDVDARTDVYGLGCTLFYLLTGTVLRERAAELEAALAERVGHQTAPAVTELLQRMTAVEPDRRPPSMAAVQAELNRLRLEHGGHVTPHVPNTSQVELLTRDAAHASTVVNGSTFVERARSKWATGLLVVAIAAAIGIAYVTRSTTDRGAAAESNADIGPSLVPEWTDRDGMEFVLLKPGRFLMGLSPEAAAQLRMEAPSKKDVEAVAWELPQREVSITRPVYLGKYEVTVGQFREFVEQVDYVTEAERTPEGGMGWDFEKKATIRGKQFSWRNPGWELTDRHPVVDVSWDDAMAFCRWKSQRESAAYRLPTEAEWEYACGISDLPVNSAVSAEDAFEFTAPVGSFPPNRLGFYDLRGNVYEWCNDWFSPSYNADEVVDPQGPPTGQQKVARGGSWSSGNFLIRPTCRFGWSRPTAFSYGTGFRVVREP